MESFTVTLARYLSSRIVSQVVGAVIAFLRPRMLTPELFGLWTLLRLIPQYAIHAHFGVRTALRVYYPLHIAREEDAQAQDLVMAGIMGSLSIDLLLGTLIATVALGWHWNGMERFGILAMALMVPLQGWHHSLFAVLKAQHRFDIIGGTNYLEAILLFISTIVLLPLFGIYGLFVSLLTTQTLLDIYLTRSANIKLRWPRQLITKSLGMIGKGWHIMSLELAMVLVMTTDRFVVSILLDTTSLGYYGVAIMIVSFLRNMPGTAREILEPRLMAEMATADLPSLLGQHCLQPTLNTAFLMPLLIGPVALAAPLAIDWLLPNYEPAVLPTQILACGVFFLALSIVLRSFVVAMGKDRIAAAFMPGIVLANVALAWAALHSGLGLPGVALASGASFLLLYILFWWVLRPELAQSAIRDRAQLLWILPVFVFTCALIGGLQLLPFGQGFVGTAIRVVLFFGIFLTLRWLAIRRLTLISPLLWEKPRLSAGGR
jgi:O-antigen/teichoic acid export membrane protein